MYMFGTSYSSVDMIAAIDTKITVHAVTSVSTGNDQTGVRKDKFDLYIFCGCANLSYSGPVAVSDVNYGASSPFSASISDRVSSLTL